MESKDHISIKDGVFISSLDVRIKDNLNSFNDFKLLLRDKKI